MRADNQDLLITGFRAERESATVTARYRPRPGHAVRIMVIAVCWLLLRAASADAQSGWTGIVNTLTIASDLSAPRIAVDADGNATTVWVRSTGAEEIIEAVRYTRATDTWSSATIVSAASDAPGEPGIAIAANAAGDATLVWTEGSTGLVRAARYTATTGSWEGTR